MNNLYQWQKNSVIHLHSGIPIGLFHSGVISAEKD